jgi:hypothetical protein
MLSPLKRSAQDTGIVRVDLDVLDSMRKAWSVPKDTGKLILPKQQNSKYANTGVSTPKSKINNLNKP